jgi:hypothetical protein
VEGLREIVPLTLREANRFVEMHHRHSGPVQGAKFAIGLLEDGKLIGVAIVGRPVARLLDDGRTAEILRVCVLPGHPNACSQLYGRAARIARLMGYRRVVTYTLERESGASLRAAGFRPAARTGPNDWDRPNRGRAERPVYAERKVRWEI